MNSLDKVGAGRRISRESSNSLGWEMGIVCCVPHTNADSDPRSLRRPLASCGPRPH